MLALMFSTLLAIILIFLIFLKKCTSILFELTSRADLRRTPHWRQNTPLGLSLLETMSKGSGARRKWKGGIKEKTIEAILRRDNRSCSDCGRRSCSDCGRKCSGRRLTWGVDSQGQAGQGYLKHFELNCSRDSGCWGHHHAEMGRGSLQIGVHKVFEVGNWRGGNC